jgi:nucleoside-diphosphate-sugar epimerase
MKILVTGANGHLGARVIKKLCIENEVHAIVRSSPPFAHPSVTYHAIDLSSDWCPKSLPIHVDAVIHLAQSRNFREFPQQALEILQVNLVSTSKLLDYASRVGVKHFVLASTGGLHRTSASVITEDSKVDPPDGPLEYYFRTKQAAELLARPYMDSIDITILRPFFIYGPGQSPDKLISRLLASIRDGRPIKLSGRDGLLINPVFVDDVVDLIFAILNVPKSRILMAAGPDVLSIRAMADLIGHQVGRNPIFEKMDGDDEKMIANHTVAESLLMRPMTGFSDGILQLLR